MSKKEQLESCRQRYLSRNRATMEAQRAARWDSSQGNTAVVAAQPRASARGNRGGDAHTPAGLQLRWIWSKTWLLTWHSSLLRLDRRTESPSDPTLRQSS